MRMEHEEARRGRGRGRGRGRHRPEPPAVTHDDLEAWFVGSLPDDWFVEPITVEFDRDEIVVTGELASPKAKKDTRAIAEAARIETFREETRESRMAVADRAQQKFGRTVSWAATCGASASDWTSASVPAMTRLRFEDRAILDTLIDAGVARSRSEALAWCVRLVGENEEKWIGSLRSALTAVEEARKAGPASG